MTKPNLPGEGTLDELLTYLPEGWDKLAYELSAIIRERKVKSPTDLVRMVMRYSGLDSSLRESAGYFTLAQGRITDTAIRKRLLACGPWLRELLARLLPGLGAAIGGGGRLLVVDSTSLVGPATAGVAFRVHLVLELAGLRLHEAHVTGVKGAESLECQSFMAGDLVMADRGYNHPAAILALGDRQVGLLARLNPHAMPLYGRVGEEAECPPGRPRLDLARRLREAVGDDVSLPVWLRGGKRFGQGWVHAKRLPPELAEKARQRCRQKARKQGRTPKDDTLFFAGWVMVFTTASPAELEHRTALELYRCRWQVELAFKLLKSLLDLDALRTRPDSLLGEVWVLGKLLYALVIERRTREALGQGSLGMDSPHRQATPWRFAKMSRNQVDAWTLQAQSWRPENWPACFSVVKERPRRRQLQTIPALANHFML